MKFSISLKILRVALLALSATLALSITACKKAKMRSSRGVHQATAGEGIDHKKQSDRSGDKANQNESKVQQETRTSYRSHNAGSGIDKDCLEGVCDKSEVAPAPEPVVTPLPKKVRPQQPVAKQQPEPKKKPQPEAKTVRAASQIDVLFMVNTKDGIKSRLEKVAEASSALFTELEDAGVSYNVAVMAGNNHVNPSIFYAASKYDPGVMHNWRLKKGNIDPIPHITSHLATKFATIPPDTSSEDNTDTGGRASLFALSKTLYDSELGEYKESFRDAITNQHFLLRENALLVIFLSHEDDYCVKDEKCAFNETHLIKLLEKTQGNRPLAIATIGNQGDERAIFGEVSTLYNSLADPARSKYGIGKHSLFSDDLITIMEDIGRKAADRTLNP